MVNFLPYDFGVDIWSLGIMTYEMITGCSPFSGPGTDILENIKAYQNFSAIKSHLEDVGASEELFDFLANMLSPESSKRMQVEEILKHPWIFKNVDFS